MTQQELPFKVKGKKPKSNPLLSMLESYDRWVTTGELHRSFGWRDRHCRDMAELSFGRIISGNKGYKASCCATPDEIDECCNRLYSQARRMSARVFAIRRVAHENLKRKK